MTRPVYVIAHRCNDLDDIDDALAKGANAIECDVRTIFFSSNWYVDHDGVFAWSTKLDEWLDRARQVADQYGEKFALIIFDIKTPKRLGELRARARAKLPPDLNLLFSTGRFRDRAAFDEIVPNLLPNEGIAIDANNDPTNIQVEFSDVKGIANFWYGNGIFVAGGGPNVESSVTLACNLRDSEHKTKKVYVWTLANTDSIRKYFADIRVDGVMVNPSTIAAAINIVNGTGRTRLALRIDPAYQVPAHSSFVAAPMVNASRNDVVLYRPTDGAFQKWHTDAIPGSTFNQQGTRFVENRAGAWSGARMIAADFDGDGKMDILVYRPIDGAFAKWYSGGGVGPGFNFQAVGFVDGTAGAWSGVRMIAADFDGDGKTDILVYRPSDGAFQKWYSDGGVNGDFVRQATGFVGGRSGAWRGVRMIALDFNNDGYTDILVYRPSDGVFAKWYSDGSVGPAFNYQPEDVVGGRPGYWSGVRMIAADFNGDKNIDILAYQPSDGAFAKWYSDGNISPKFNYQPILHVGGRPSFWRGVRMIPADFDADGNTDVLVYQPSDGAFAKWYSDGGIGPRFNFQASHHVAGQPGAWRWVRMLAADFDGDGNTDVMVYRSSDGAFAKWYSDGGVGSRFNFQQHRFAGGAADAWNNSFAF